MGGIVGYGAYVPYYRLQRSAIGSALGSGGGKGTRSVASFDEDTTSMGVEAGRSALHSLPGVAVDRVLFTTPNPAYLDKTNATAIHAALGLPSTTGAYDLLGSVRSIVGAMRLAFSSDGTSLLIASDLRTGLPGGADERDGGDAAVAFVFGNGPALVEGIGRGGATAEFLDRWRIPGELADGQWEERFGEHAYVPLAEQATVDAFKMAGITASEVDHLIVAGLHNRAVRTVAKTIGARPEAIVDDRSTVIGNTGAAQPLLMLADVLDRAQPGQIIAIVLLADGADVLLLRTTEALASYRPAATVAEQVAGGRDDLSYSDFLTWRGFLKREPPRRPDPERPAAPPSLRTEHWKFGFEGSRCDNCGTRHLPPARVCVRCQAVDQMSRERLADVPATVATYTIDRLAYSLSPPVVVGVIDFDGGGRFQCEMTDVDPAHVAIGDRVEMTFRRLFTAAGVHNYFWKARPVRATQEKGN